MENIGLANVSWFSKKSPEVALGKIVQQDFFLRLLVENGWKVVLHNSCQGILGVEDSQASSKTIIPFFHFFDSVVAKGCPGQFLPTNT